MLVAATPAAAAAAGATALDSAWAEDFAVGAVVRDNIVGRGVCRCSVERCWGLPIGSRVSLWLLSGLRSPSAIETWGRLEWKMR